jgi:hypothetical protein
MTDVPSDPTPPPEPPAPIIGEGEEAYGDAHTTPDPPGAARPAPSPSDEEPASDSPSPPADAPADDPRFRKA